MERLDIGNSDFKSIRESDYYYVDKSLFIKEVINSPNQVLLIPRPRRFGKTLNILMLKYFFEKGFPENAKLFTNLKIIQEKDAMGKLGKYPTIFLSFKDAKGKDWTETLELIEMEIARLYESHKYLLKSDILSDNEKVQFNQITSLSAQSTNFQNSLKKLSDYLYRFHKEKIVILIDEYDTPIQSGYNLYYDEVVLFMRSLLSGAFKDNSNLYKGVITGILRVSKESIFSGLNNLGVYTILECEFADKFGFTEEETKQILSDQNIGNHFDEVKKWYNGYTIGDKTDMYNPWSILNYAARYKNGFKPYWINTSSDGLLKQRIKQKKSNESREIILKLLNGECIKKDVHENFVFPELETKLDLLWTLLLFSGYLTIVKQLGTIQYELKIPNYEIRFVFQNILLGWFETDIQLTKSLLEETANHLIHNRLDNFENGFKKIIGDTFSYYDIDGEPEKVYQAYTLGMLAILCDDYIIRSNRESGEGRYDILMIPHDKSKNGVVIEIKTLDKKKRESEKKLNERIQKELQVAAEQIKTNEYYKELVDHKVTNIIQLPIVFVGKNSYIGKTK